MLSLAITIAVLTITIRSCYRLAELQGGFNGKLANNEPVFMIFEGPMIIIAVVVLTIWHPGYVLGTRVWQKAGFHMRTPKNIKSQEDASTESLEMKEGARSRDPEAEV